jgi:hypothetical protein
MFTKSYPSPRWLSAYVLTSLLFCVSFGGGVEAYAATPVVTGSFASTPTPPSKLGTVYQTALDSFGDLLFVDYVNGGLYEYPVGGGAVITLLPATSLGGYANPGIAIGAANDLYLEGNYSNCLLRFPYDAAKATWDGLSTISAANGNNSTAPCPNGSGGSYTAVPPYGFTEGGTPAVSPGYFQPWAIAIDPNNNVLISDNNSNNFIFTLPVIGTGVTSTPGSAGQSSFAILSLSARAQSIAEDKFGNIYFVEETDQKAPLPGVLMIPAGSNNVASDAGLTRVDPNLPAVSGVTTDAAGNLYISDSKDGVFFVPNPSGTPQTSAAVLLTPLPAYGQVSVDLTRNILWVPSQQSGSEVISKVSFNAAKLGSTATGAPATTSQSVLFGFNSAETPGSFVIQEAGATTPDFVIASGGTCVGGTAYAALSGCSVNVTLSPNAAGNVSAKLLVLDASSNVLGSITLQGTGTGSAVQVLPGGESVIGAGLKTPSQVAVDANGNTYVADSGLAAVEMYPKGTGAVAATTTVGTVKAPTGVAVDGGGDVFIADSGSVFEVPIGASGPNTTGQITLKTGLGSNLNLAVDGVGHLYIADPTNGRVVKLGNVLGGSAGLLGQTETDLTGFIAPSAVAVDASGDLFVADGSNLYEVTPGGTQTTLLTSLPAATGLAVDPSGAVYVATSGGTRRIPNLGGTLTPGSDTTVASNVTAPTSVAIDSAENVYITDPTAEDVEFVSASATTNFGTLTSQTGTQASDYTIVNAGNSALNITGYTGTPDYSVTNTTCTTAAIAVGADCTATVTFNPGPGDQGTLAGQVLLQSNAANEPVGVNVTGVGAPLAASTTTVSVKSATVDGAPAVITVAATSGTGAVPTGQVTLTITGTNLTTPVVVTGTLANGTVTIAPPQLAAGTYTYTISYQGDRVYGTSTAKTQVTIAAGAVTLVQPPLTPSINLVYLGGVYYILANGNGSDQPYDGSIAPFEFSYNVQVAATDGVALIGQPVYTTSNGLTKQTATNYGSVTYQGASTANCSPIPVQSNGAAPFTASCLAINVSNTSIPDLETTYTITPVYSPTATGSSCGTTCTTNPNYAAFTGTPIAVTALRNPVVQITSSPSSLTVAPGSTVTATLTLTSLFGFGYVGGGDAAASGGLQEPKGSLLNNYTLPVQLACDGLPAYATCTFSYPTPDVSDPNSVAVGPPPGTVIPSVTSPCTASVGCVGPGTVIMTITTNIPTGIIASLHRSGADLKFATLFGFGLLGLAFGKKRRSLRGIALTLTLLLLSSGLAAGISGCSTQQLGTTSSTTSPAGNYTVSVTAKQVGSRTVTVVPGIVYGNGNQMSLPFSMNLTVQ